MVFLEEQPNQIYTRQIQDWLSQSWIYHEPDPAYREALQTVLQLMQRGSGRGISGRGLVSQDRISFLPLPSLCAFALGRVPRAITQVNAAWVLLYMASFLLDKIEDQETDDPVFAQLQAQFGYGAAANLTTGLILHAGRILAELEADEETGAETIDAARRRFHLGALEVCAGQHLDLTVREPSFQQIWEIVDAKSGKFFALGAFLGARLASANDAQAADAQAADAQVALLEQVGRRLGILVQIGNDLGGFGSGQETGSDLAGGKRTLPVLYALQVLPAEARARLSELLAAAPVDPSAEIAARKIIISAGAIVYLSLEAEKHRQQAVKALSQLGLEARQTRPLLDLLDFASPIKNFTQHSRS